MDPDTIGEATETTPLQSTYGSSEVGHATSGSKLPIGLHPSEADLAKTESLFVDMRLIDEDWNEVDGRGELAISGPTLLSGYVDAPETNDADFRDCWFRTGNIFTCDSEGRYSFESRRKYLIKSGGENIYPKEIEDPIAELDEVADVVVFRADNAVWGEVPRAVIVTTVSPDEAVLRDRIHAKLKERIARYKLPHYVEFCDPSGLPRSTSGEIARPEVEDWPLEESTSVCDP